MRITGFRLARLRVPLKTPFKTALREVDAIDDVVLLLDTDSGAVGYGSAPATAMITGETHASIIEALSRHIAPRVIGRDISELPALLDTVANAMAHNSSAKAAADIALHDLAAQSAGLSLARFLGGSAVQELTTDVTISVNDVAKMVGDTRDALALGFTALKVKVGKVIAEDLARIRAIHAAVAGRATLRLDANQGWTPEEAVAAVLAIEAEGIVLELVEQPVKGYDLEGLRFVRERVRTPVMADEAVFSPHEAQRVLREGAADILNIKLMKSGGLAGASRIAALASEQGAPCMMGCMLESSIGVAAAAHFAAAHSAAVTLIDLDSPALGQFDPVDGNTRFDHARIHLGDTPGLGIRGIAGLQFIHP